MLMARTTSRKILIPISSMAVRIANQHVDPKLDRREGGSGFAGKSGSSTKMSAMEAILGSILRLHFVAIRIQSHHEGLMRLKALVKILFTLQNRPIQCIMPSRLVLKFRLGQTFSRWLTSHGVVKTIGLH